MLSSRAIRYAVLNTSLRFLRVSLSGYFLTMCWTFKDGGEWQYGPPIGGLLLAAILVDIAKHVHIGTRIWHRRILQLSIIS